MATRSEPAPTIAPDAGPRPDNPIDPPSEDQDEMADGLTKATHKKPRRKKAPAKKAVGVKAAAAPTDAGVVNAEKADEAVDKIQRELTNLDRNGGLSVASLIAAGVSLVDLQAATGTERNWTERVKKIKVGTRRHRHLNPRIARRLLKLGKSWWGGENGPPGSEILEQLPTDLQKLTWLCRLTSEQLEDLLGRVDCKEEGRQHVIDAVKVMLPDFRPKEAKINSVDRVVASFKKAVAKSVKALKEVHQPAAGTDDLRDRLREALDETLAELRPVQQGGAHEDEQSTQE